ncbi:MAG TPA: hypothetical protein VG106_04740, partial [Vicinamibacterales bacterium]|nr:hypothetical protein [Vicinamibacterales bacterium]
FAYEKRSTSQETDGPNNLITVSCSAGKRVLGGGYTSTGNSVRVYVSAPTASNDGWQVNVREDSGNPTVTVWAICATVQ